MNIIITEKEYKPWGRCVCVANDEFEFYATLDFGPRIIRFAPIGKENIFYEDYDDEVNAEEFIDKSYEYFGQENGIWHLRGGHRLWTSPEEFPETYYPDNEPVSYVKKENGIVLTPPEQKVRNLQMVIDISFVEKNSVRIIHKLKNVGKNSLTYAPWALSVMSKGGTEIFPAPTLDNEYNHPYFWSFSDRDDERLTLGDKYITLKQDPQAKTDFKMGHLNPKGWAAYFNHGDVFIDRFDIGEDKLHPDFNCNFETFTSNVILEIESLGELREISSGEEVELTECWSYFKNVDVPTSEAEIDLFAERFNL